MQPTTPPVGDGPYLIDGGLLTITYSGRDADDNSVELGQFAQSLRGWEQLLRLAADEIVLRDFKGHHAHNVSFVSRVRPLREGSLQLVLESLFWGVLGNAIWDGIKLFSTRFLPAARGLITRLKEAKEENLSIREAAERLRALEQYSAVETLPSPPPEKQLLLDEADAIATEGTLAEEGHASPADARVRKIIIEADNAIRDAIAPAGNSVDSIRASAPDFGVLIEITDQERRIFGRAFRPEDVPPTQLMQQRRIRFLGLNRVNGWGKFEFVDNPDSPDEQHQQECKVSDPALRARRDRYTRALYEASSMTVWLDKKIRESGTSYWEIKALDDDGQSLLFR